MVHPQRPGQARLLVGVLVLALVGVACSGQDDGLVAVEQQPVPGDSSSTITAEVPDDWQLVTAGVGTEEQDAGRSCFTHEPYTVVKTATDGRSIKVSAATLDGCDNGLVDKSLAFGVGDPEELEINGHAALLTPSSEIWEDDRPDLPPDLVDLVVDVDGSSVVRAQSTDATRAELIEVASLAVLNGDPRVAPRFDELPDGFEVVGSVNATGVQALRARLSAGTDLVPGDDRTHTLGWTTGPTGSTPATDPLVSVLAVPAGTINLEAMKLAHPIWSTDGSVELIEVGGRPAARLGRTLVTETEWGDQLIIAADANQNLSDSPPSTPEQLTQVATSVRQAEQGRWRDHVEEASGGPGLTANVGRSEVARGEVEGIEWLLQTSDRTYSFLAVDACLKLSDGDTACATLEDGEPEDDLDGQRSVAMGISGADELPFAILVIPNDDPAVEVRFTTGDTTISAPFHAVSGTANKASVLFAAPGDRFDCPAPGPGIGPESRSVQPPVPLIRYDDTGNPLGCLNS